jgi:4-hydroxybenzoate polyprenyltransferase
MSKSFKIFLSTVSLILSGLILVPILILGLYTIILLPFAIIFIIFFLYSYYKIIKDDNKDKFNYFIFLNVTGIICLILLLLQYSYLFRF